MCIRDSQAADLMQAAAIITTVVYNAANRGEMLPRKALPKQQPKAGAGQGASGAR